MVAPNILIANNNPVFSDQRVMRPDVFEILCQYGEKPGAYDTTQQKAFIQGRTAARNNLPLVLEIVKRWGADGLEASCRGI